MPLNIFPPATLTTAYFAKVLILILSPMSQDINAGTNKINPGSYWYLNVGAVEDNRTM